MNFTIQRAAIRSVKNFYFFQSTLTSQTPNDSYRAIMVSFFRPFWYLRTNKTLRPKPDCLVLPPLIGSREPLMMLMGFPDTEGRIDGFSPASCRHNRAAPILTVTRLFLFDACYTQLAHQMEARFHCKAIPICRYHNHYIIHLPAVHCFPLGVTLSLRGVLRGKTNSVKMRGDGIRPPVSYHRRLYVCCVFS